MYVNNHNSFESKTKSFVNELNDQNATCVLAECFTAGSFQSDGIPHYATIKFKNGAHVKLSTNEDLNRWLAIFVDAEGKNVYQLRPVGDIKYLLDEVMQCIILEVI